MSIETASKLADIVFKGALATGIAAATLYVTWNKNVGDRIGQCDTFFTKLVEAASAAKATDLNRQSMQYRITNYGALCGNLEEAQVQAIMNVMEPPEVEKNDPSIGGRVPGWVALSRIPATKFADTNFDNVNGSADFRVGDVVKARWSVNLREKNTPVSKGDNPIVDVIEAGTCVKIDQRVTGALNEWAHVGQIECS